MIGLLIGVSQGMDDGFWNHGQQVDCACGGVLTDTEDIFPMNTILHTN